MDAGGPRHRHPEHSHPDARGADHSRIEPRHPRAAREAAGPLDRGAPQARCGGERGDRAGPCRWASSRSGSAGVAATARCRGIRDHRRGHAPRGGRALVALGGVLAPQRLGRAARPSTGGSSPTASSPIRSRMPSRQRSRSPAPGRRKMSSRVELDLYAANDIEVDDTSSLVIRTGVRRVDRGCARGDLAASQRALRPRAGHSGACRLPLHARHLDGDHGCLAPRRARTHSARTPLLARPRRARPDGCGAGRAARVHRVRSPRVLEAVVAADPPSRIDPSRTRIERRGHETFRIVHGHRGVGRARRPGTAAPSSPRALRGCEAPQPTSGDAAPTATDGMPDGGAVELRTMSVACSRSSTGGCVRIAQALNQKLDGVRPLLARRLLERREREHLGVLVVVDPDDAEDARDRQPQAPGGDDRTDRDFVARSRRWPWDAGGHRRAGRRPRHSRRASSRARGRGRSGGRHPPSSSRIRAAAPRRRTLRARLRRRGTRCWCAAGRCRCSVARRAAWRSSMATTFVVPDSPTTLTRGRPIATSRSSSWSLGSSPTAMSPSNRLRARKSSKTRARPSVPGRAS